MKSHRIPFTLCVLLAAALLLFGAFTPSSLQAESSKPFIITKPIEGRSETDQVGPIRMSKMTVLQALDLLREFSGRVIVPGEGLPRTELNFNTGTALSRRDAIFAIEHILSLNGVRLRMNDNGMVTALPASHPDRRTVTLITELPEGADSEQIFSKLFSLEFISANTAWHRLRHLTTPGRSSIHQMTETSHIMVTDTLSNLRRFKEILSVIDAPPETRQELYTFHIKHDSAWNIRTQLIQLARSGLSQRMRETTIYADSRTNLLWVATHPANFDFIQRVVEEFDQEVAPFTTTEVLRIENANFWTLWSMVNGIIRTQQHLFARQRFRSAEATTLEPSARRVGTDGIVEELLPTDGTAPEGGEDAISAVEIARPDSDPNLVMVEEAMPELQFSPYIAIFADAPNNAIVVYGTQSDIRRMQALIKQVDVRSPPYVTSEVVEIVHAQADDIRNIAQWTIWVQQSTFGRQGFRTGEDRADAGSRAAIEDGFEFSPFVATIANRRNNTLIVQGTQRDIQQIKRLVSQLDVEAAPLTMNEVIFLEHAEAGTLGRVVQNIINFQRNIFARQRMQTQAMREDGTMAQGEAPSLGFEFSQFATINADRRTNALFVFGTRQDIERVRQIVSDADIPVEPLTTTRIFSLTHTDANQTSGLINRLINNQNRALRQVRSETRGVRNPAAAAGEDAELASLVEGEEALQFSPFISVTPDRRSNSLVVYGTRSDVRQVQELLRDIDIEVAPLTRSEVFLLENTQANSLFSVLNNMIRGQERALRRVRSSIMEVRNIRPDDPDAEVADIALQAMQFSPFVTITPNARNNSIIVFGTNSDIEQLASLIRVSDVKIAPRTQSRTFFIRHATASDVSRTISDLIRQQQRVREREATLTRVFRRDGMMGGEDRMDEGPGDNDGLGTLIQETSTRDFADIMSYDEDMQFSPYVSLVADTRSNSVLAYGTAFDLEQVALLIEQVDRVLTQVRIEVVIAEVTLSGDQVSGLESFGINYRNPFDFQAGATVDGDIGLQGRAPGVGSTGNPALDIGMTLSDFSLNSVFRVARQNNLVKVLSAPSITTTHNRQATINVGEARPVITGSASNLASNNLVTRSEIEFRDIGITLRVRPLVSEGEDSFIQMDLEQIVETVIDEQTIDGNVQPIIGTRRANSFVSVRDQEVIVMGGLQSVENTNREGRVAILGDIPIFGGMFRPKSQSQVVRELVIFIQPYIVTSTPRGDIVRRENLEGGLIAPTIEHYLESGRFEEIEQMLERARQRNLLPEKERAEEEEGADNDSSESGVIYSPRAPDAAVQPERENGVSNGPNNGEDADADTTTRTTRGPRR